jgi:hypothetical protein
MLRHHLAVVIAGAGRTVLMKRAVQQIEAAFDTVYNPKLEKVQQTMENALKAFFKCLFYQKPRYEEQD